MKTIVKNNDAIPGIARLLAVPINYISIINNGTIQFTVPLAGVVYAFENSIDTASSSVKIVHGDAGTHYEVNIKTFIQGLSLENLSLLKEMSLFKHMVIFQSYEGDYWRLGNKSVGLKFSYHETTSPAIGYELTFSGNVLEPSKGVNATSVNL